MLRLISSRASLCYRRIRCPNSDRSTLAGGLYGLADNVSLVECPVRDANDLTVGFWRRSAGFHQHAFAANIIVMTCGFILAGYQLVGFATQSSL